MSHHDPDLPPLSALTPEDLSRAAGAILASLLDSPERLALAGFAEAIFRGPGPILARLADRSLARVLAQEAEGAARPGAYGRLQGLPTVFDLDGPVWRADGDLRARLGARLAHLLEGVHHLATHPGDPLEGEEADLLRRLVVLTRLAVPTLAEGLRARLEACLAARFPRDLDLAIHRLRQGLAGLDPATPGLDQTLWRMAILDRVFGAQLLTGLPQADQARALDEQGPAEAAFAAQVRASGALIARDDTWSIWERSFGTENPVPRATERRKVHSIGAARAKG